jgi:hypothetical protein
VAASTHATFKDTVPMELKEQASIAIWVGVELDDSTSRPADVPLESWLPAPLNEQPFNETNGTRAALKPAPPDKKTLVAAATLQALKLVFETLIAAARDTANPPPRTAVKGEYCPAPLAEQFQKVLDDNTTEALLPSGISTDTPPPLLLEGGKPTALIATVTEQLLNDDDCMLTLANATLLAWTAPPQPLAVPGRTDFEVVDAEHAVKLELKMKNVRLYPASFSAWGGRSTVIVSLNADTWGECISDTAPPYTEVVPREVESENETALQFVNELPVTAMRLSRIVVIPKDVYMSVGSPNRTRLYTNAPATMTTAPPIACSRITKTKMVRVIIAKHDIRWIPLKDLRLNRVNKIQTLVCFNLKSRIWGFGAHLR